MAKWLFLIHFIHFSYIHFICEEHAFLLLLRFETKNLQKYCGIPSSSSLSALVKEDFRDYSKAYFLYFCSSLLLLLFFLSYLHFDFSKNSTLFHSYFPPSFLLCLILFTHRLLSLLTSPTGSWSLLLGTTIRNINRRKTYVFVMVSGSHLFFVNPTFYRQMSPQDHFHIYVELTFVCMLESILCSIWKMLQNHSWATHDRMMGLCFLVILFQFHAKSGGLIRTQNTSFERFSDI